MRSQSGEASPPPRTDASYVLTCATSVRTLLAHPQPAQCTEPAVAAFAPGAGRVDGRSRAVTQVKQALKTLVALLKAGPWGHPIVTHHHLHKD